MPTSALLKRLMGLGKPDAGWASVPAREDREAFLRGIGFPDAPVPSFFVLRRFNAQESETLYDALNGSGENVIFSDDGHIQLKTSTQATVVYLNPTVSTVKVEGKSLAALVRDGKGQFAFDTRLVASRNLKYLLANQQDAPGKANEYLLLFNPLHRRDFRQYYNQVMSTASPSETSFGATTVGTGADLSLQQVFASYCASMIRGERQGDGSLDERSFADPTCNLFLGADRCAYSSNFGLNRVEYDKEKVALAESGTLLRTLRAGAPPNCACLGATHSWATNQANLTSDTSESFLADFRPNGDALKTCDPSVTNVVCQILVRADANTIRDSHLSNQCGIPPPRRSEPGDPPPPPPSPQQLAPAAAAAPPAVAATPPAVAATPPAVAATPPAVAATPPAVAATPPAVAATPPAVAATPPAVAATPPAVAATPPAAAAASPTAEAASPGEEPGQRELGQQESDKANPESETVPTDALVFARDYPFVVVMIGMLLIVFAQSIASRPTRRRV